MKSEIDAALTAMAEEAHRANPAGARRELELLLSRLGASRCREHRAQIESAVERAFPLMKKSRLQLLEKVATACAAEQAEQSVASGIEQTTHAREPQPAEPRRPRPGNTAATSLKRDLRDQVREVLEDLGSRHIFQWSNQYAPAVRDIFEKCLALPGSSEALLDVGDVLADAFAEHSEDIFQRGYVHQISNAALSEADVLAKAQHGLRKFLELPMTVSTGFASARLASRSDAWYAWGCCSGMTAGIIEGFGSAQMGDASGWSRLTSDPSLFMDKLGVLRPYEIQRVLNGMPNGELRDSILRVLEPAADAAWSTLGRDATVAYGIPTLSEYNDAARMMTTGYSLVSPSADRATVDIAVFLDSSTASASGIREALRERADVAIATLGLHELASLQQFTDLSERVATAEPGGFQDPEALKQRMLEILETAVTSAFGVELEGRVLKYNYADQFPIENVNLQMLYKVHRSSVSRLLQSFESRNGIHLWCSPRRSGKSTACRELEGATGASVVYQTCSDNCERDRENEFYSAVRTFIDEGQRLPQTFVEEFAQRLAPLDVSSVKPRHILIIDEYESLFRELELALEDDDQTRYKVVKPLLDQLVAFARDNLIILVGMWPDAHYIMMDQNMLSTHVEHDRFPLFYHRSSVPTSELANLLEKALTPNLEFDSQFADRVYRETAGHPYLTVRLLAHILEWLIREQRQLSCPELDDAVYSEFEQAELEPRSVAANPRYRVFRMLIESTSDPNRMRENRWLYAVHASLRQHAVRFGPHGECSEDDYLEIWRDLDLDSTGLDPLLVLSSAHLANFLRHENGLVRAAIPLMSRIAGGIRHA